MKQLPVANHQPSVAVRRRRFERGFSLLELLVVIAIIGILVAVGMNSFGSAETKARDSQRKADLDQVQKALELYQQDQALPAYPAGDWTAMETALTPYMGDFPVPPSAGESYYYQSPSPRAPADSLTYDLYACLENINDPKRDDDDGGAGDRCAASGLVSYTVIEP